MVEGDEMTHLHPYINSTNNIYMLYQNPIKYSKLELYINIHIQTPKTIVDFGMTLKKKTYKLFYIYILSSCWV